MRGFSRNSPDFLGFPPGGIGRPRRSRSLDTSVRSDQSVDSMTHFRFDGFVLSPDKLSLHQGDDIVRLEPRLTELLVFLVERRDRVVSKDELIEGVWQGRFVGVALDEAG